MIQEILSLGEDKNYWIGLNDQETEGAFIWDHHGIEAEFFAWAAGEPNGDENENCVSMRSENTYFWSDEDCNLPRTPMCYGNVLVNPCPEGWELAPAFRVCYLIGGGGTNSWGYYNNYCKDKGGLLVK